MVMKVNASCVAFSCVLVVGTFASGAAFAQAPAPNGTADPSSPPAAARPNGGGPNVSPPQPAATTTEIPPAVLEEATRIYKLGQEAYSKGRYDSAFTSFHHAYQMTKAPDLLYNLAKVSVKLGQREVAVGYYRQYIAGHPADEAAVQKELDDLLVASPLGTTAQPATAAATTPAAEPEIPRWVPWAMIGGGAGFLGVSIGLLVAGGISPADTAADQSQRRAMLASGGVLGGIGLAATIGGAVLKLRMGKPAEAPKTARVFLAPAGLGLQLVGSY